MNDVLKHITTEGYFSDAEKIAYWKLCLKKAHAESKELRHLHLVSVEEDGEEFVDVHYDTFTPFQRLRRITGYLVGDLGSFNDAKRAEEKDRVKHNA